MAVRIGSGHGQAKVHLRRRLNHLHAQATPTRPAIAQRGFVGQRRRLLNYLQKNDIERYRSLIERLGLRR